MSYTGGIDTHAFYRFMKIMEGGKRYLNKDRKEDTPGKIVRRAITQYRKYGSKIEGSHFREVYEMNSGSMREDIEMDDLASFVLAAYFDKRVKGLWYVDEFGNLQEPREHKNDEETDKDFDYICIGSGGEDMERFIEKQVLEGEIEHRDIDIKRAIRIVKACLDEAPRKDSSTGYLKDVAIINSQGVRRYGEKFKNALTEAEEQVWSLIEEED